MSFSPKKFFLENYQKSESELWAIIRKEAHYYRLCENHLANENSTKDPNRRFETRKEMRNYRNRRKVLIECVLFVKGKLVENRQKSYGVL